MVISVYKTEHRALAARTMSVTINAMRKCLMNKSNVKLNKGMCVSESKRKGLCCCCKPCNNAVLPVVLFEYMHFLLKKLIV